MAASRRSLLAGLALVAGHVPPGAARAAGRSEFLLIRHGESYVNIAPDPQLRDAGVSYPLTPVGMVQAKRMAAGLPSAPSVIWASTRLRAIQTADAVAWTWGGEVRLAPELVEVDFGDVARMADKVAMLAEVRRIYDGWLDGRSSAGAPDGEDFDAVKARFLPAARRIIGEAAGAPGPAVLVAHGALLAATAPSLFVNVSPAFARASPLRNCAVIRGERSADGALRCLDWDGKTPT